MVGGTRSPTTGQMDPSRLCLWGHSLGWVGRWGTRKHKINRCPQLKAWGMSDKRESHLLMEPQDSEQSPSGVWKQRRLPSFPWSSSLFHSLDEQLWFILFGYTAILPINSKCIMEPVPSSDLDQLPWSRPALILLNQICNLFLSLTHMNDRLIFRKKIPIES